MGQTPPPPVWEIFPLNPVFFLKNYYGLDGHTRASLFTRSSQKTPEKNKREKREKKWVKLIIIWGNKILPKVFIMVTVQSLSPTNESLHCIEDMLVVHILIR